MFFDTIWVACFWPKKLNPIAGTCPHDVCEEQSWPEEGSSDPRARWRRNLNHVFFYGKLSCKSILDIVVLTPFSTRTVMRAHGSLLNLFSHLVECLSVLTKYCVILYYLQFRFMLGSGSDVCPRMLLKMALLPTSRNNWQMLCS